MDSSANRKFVNRILATDGAGRFYETEYNLPPLNVNEICVRSVMTGVCRSDIDMMTGDFARLPLAMQGHEGLGQVIGIGSDVKNIKVGQYVATRGEPAYADIYNVRDGEFVIVPEAHPRYILEPVACGINIIHQPLKEIAERAGGKKRLLILGSGFLAWVAFNVIKLYHLEFEITVVGNSNKKLWGNTLTKDYEGTFDVVIDLNSNMDVFEKPILNNQALVVFGSQKTVNTNFSNLLWKACTMIFTSPRSETFYYSMKNAAYWIQRGDIVVDYFWTKGYNRDSEWSLAFSEGLNRTTDYSRGYIYWNKNDN